MKGYYVLKLIVSIYALFMAAVCPKDQKKTEPDHEKNLFIRVSEQVVLKLKHAQLHMKPN